MREKIAKYREINPQSADFYEGCEIYLDTIDILGERLYKEAVSKADEAQDEQERREYLKIAEAYSVIPQNPAYDMRSAALMFWMIFTFDGIDSPGHLDQFFNEYWQKDEPKNAMLQLECLWLFFHDTRTWNLCIGGSDENWNDKTNDVSYAVLDVAEKYKFHTSNLTMHVHRNTPEKLWRRAVEVIATGIGMPVLYNDEVVCPALEKMGIPPEDSHLYCMSGCNHIDIMGKSHMGLEDGEVDFGKCLEFTLHDGYDTKIEKIISIHTGAAEKFISFEELMQVYFAGGGQQMSINVLSHDDLIDAQKNPEKYGDLVVRVGGYSACFIYLARELQDNIIARTNH